MCKMWSTVLWHTPTSAANSRAVQAYATKPCSTFCTTFLANAKLQHIGYPIHYPNTWWWYSLPTSAVAFFWVLDEDDYGGNCSSRQRLLSVFEGQCGAVSLHQCHNEHRLHITMYRAHCLSTREPGCFHSFDCRFKCGSYRASPSFVQSDDPSKEVITFPSGTRSTSPVQLHTIAIVPWREGFHSEQPSFRTTPCWQPHNWASFFFAGCRTSMDCTGVTVAAEEGVCHKTVLHILHDILGYRKIAAHWVSHTLSEVQQWQRYATAQDLLNRYQKEGDDFLGRIVTLDETWALSYEPHLKRQSNEWKHPGSPHPKTVRPTQSNVKAMFIVALMEWYCRQ